MERILKQLTPRTGPVPARVGNAVVLDMTTASAATNKEFVVLLDRVVSAVARAEALPHDALRAAHPRERCLEDVRLEQPELTVGCWASG